ncbi:Glycosyltransferase [Hyella patelloides LEGE 07179]|uniref:Glycosyltransferase n=1 Tax=Hyella patelloides LEGE 07179 TaxID=945734 RepID=A0A563VP96_9CYAN|nr:glycosyltransferase [Hyella patelloides]VEP13234.1 Glycosyltransferase [Hyella patelloides LEGE 07179]
MRIAFIVETFPALSETFILNQITGLIDRGHQVDIYAVKPREAAKVHADVIKYNLLQHTFYRDFPRNYLLRFLVAIKLILQNIYKNPLRLLKALRTLNFFKLGKKAFSLRLFHAAASFVGGDDYDIIQCHLGHTGNLAVFLKQIALLKGKIVTTFHGVDISQMLIDNDSDFYAELFEKGDLQLPISNTWKQKLIDLGCDESKITIHKMGIDLDKFEFRPRLPKTKQKTRILTVARLKEKKGIEYGIRAVAIIAKEYPQLEYQIVGDGELRSQLEQLIEDLNVSNWVTILGSKTQEEVVQLMQNSDIMLAPSVTSQQGDCEGIPVVLMEASAVGLPIVSTLHSGIPELVKDGKSGFLVPEKDIDQLAEKIKKLLFNPDLGVIMGNHGREIVVKEHDINQLNDRLNTIFHQLLASDSTSGEK